MRYQIEAGVIVPFIQKFYKQMIIVVAGLFIASMGAMTFNASAAVTSWDQGFETDTSGWLDSSNSWYGTATRVASGTNEITSSDGNWHAEFEGAGSSAPFSRFDGYKDTWQGTWTAEIDVYLDPSWDLGTGFDYSVASSTQSDSHLRDFIFHVGVVEDEGLLVNASNNTDFSVNSFKLLNENGGDYEEITEAGWYTMQHVFRDELGSLAVDLNLLDEEGNVLFTATRSNASDTIDTVVGGNDIAWFTFINVGGGIAVDNHRLILNDAAYPRTAEITSPLSGDTVSGSVDFNASLNDDDADAIQWAVRQGTCAAGTNTVFGNVDGHSDVATMDQSDLSNQKFAFTGDMSSLIDGDYCFIYNPVEDSGETNIRLTREFTLDTHADVKGDCKELWMNGVEIDEEIQSFRNQGDCVSYFATGGNNPATNGATNERANNKKTN